jgi:hypothetical protein
MTVSSTSFTMVTGYLTSSSNVKEKFQAGSITPRHYSPKIGCVYTPTGCV